jgi:hypothetical protein
MGVNFLRVFEVLCAFRRVNEHLRVPPELQVGRLVKELSKREIHTTEDEFEGFARWVSAKVGY